MRILPVIDLLDGTVVRGQAGRRDEYRPIRSLLVDDPHPMTVARAFRDKLGLNEIYLADLDGIQSRRPNEPLYRTLSDEGFTVHVDAGLCRADDASRLFDAGAASVIAGLETVEGPKQLAALCDRFGTERILFSLDLNGGRPLKRSDLWESDDPFRIAEVAYASGIREMIVLDLAAVGMSTGVPTMELCAQLRHSFPDLKLITGGGVRGVEDLHQLSEKGINGVLLASALHDGIIGREEIQSLRSNVSG